MQDMMLLETCQHCGQHLTLMESIKGDSSQQLCLITKCLSCGSHPMQEVAELRESIGYVRY